jgi:L-lactate dehydrogenase
MREKKVFIVGGGGMVGATAAYALTIKEVVEEVVLLDVDADKVRGQAYDINDAAAYTDCVRVRTGNYSEIQEDDIVVLTCGVPQKPGQSRLELLDTNAKIIKDVVGKVMAQGKKVFIVVVANPVDVMTHVALEESGLPKERVFGTGTSLDTARLRVAIADDLKVSQRNVHAYILGEHGDSSFPALSGATIGGVPLNQFPGFNPSITNNIDREIREAASTIINTKGATYYGIGNVISRVVEALTQEVGSIYPVCSLAEGEYSLGGVVIGLPCLVSSRGAKILTGYPLNDAEQAALGKSAQIIKDAASKVL